MFTAYTCKGLLVRAKDSKKADGPFACPGCHKEVVLKRGYIKRPHFAHSTLSDCRYGTGESETHRLAKFALYDALQAHAHVTNLHVEYVLDTRRADVFFCLAERYNIALEIQFSPIPIDEIIIRTQQYARHNVHVLWMPPYREELERAPYTPQPWEQYVHTLYFGVIYYWCKGDVVQPVRFRPLRHMRQEHKRQTEHRSNHVDTRERLPVLLPRRSITTLRPLQRKDWQYGDYYFPASLLWGLDNRART